MKDRTCCFSGHRTIPSHEKAALEQRLEDTVRSLIAAGITYFGTGGACGFDTLAAQTVLRLKMRFAHIRLILVLPCENQAKYWDERNTAVYEDIYRRADKIVYTSRDYTPDCMFKRNRHLVDHSSVCVCYMTETGGGTAYTVEYAKQKGLRLLNMA